MSAMNHPCIVATRTFNFLAGVVYHQCQQFGVGLVIGAFGYYSQLLYHPVLPSAFGTWRISDLVYTLLEPDTGILYLCSSSMRNRCLLQAT